MTEIPADLVTKEQDFCPTVLLSRCAPNGVNFPDKDFLGQDLSWWWLNLRHKSHPQRQTVPDTWALSFQALLPALSCLLLLSEVKMTGGMGREHRCPLLITKGPVVLWGRRYSCERRNSYAPYGKSEHELMSASGQTSIDPVLVAISLLWEPHHVLSPGGGLKAHKSRGRKAL